jgi:hypothetical protein
VDEERAAESNMREYLDKVNALKNRVFATQTELESQEEEVKKMQEQFE